MNLREIKKSVGTLPHEKLMKLDVWLHELIKAAQAQRRDRAAAVRVMLQGRQADKRTYCLEHVRCGKENCKCARGHLHGPYWYCYWTEGGRTKSQYIGKKLPRGVGRRLSRARESDNLMQTRVLS